LPLPVGVSELPSHGTGPEPALTILLAMIVFAVGWLWTAAGRSGAAAKVSA